MPAYLGLDLGKKRVGIAVSDEQGMIASPLKTVEFRSRQFLLQELQRLIDDYRVGTVIVGLPIDLKGKESIAADWVKGHAGWFKERIPAEWIYWDERLSTQEVEKMLIRHEVAYEQRRRVIDQLAAQRILQNYLDFCRIKKEKE